MHGNIPGHFFHACRADRDPMNYRIGLEGNAFLDWVPVPRVDPWPPPISRPNGKLGIGRAPFPAVPLDPRQTAIFDSINDRRSVRECLQAAGLDAAQPAAVDFARFFFRALWRVGYMLFRKPKIEG